MARQFKLLLEKGELSISIPVWDFKYQIVEEDGKLQAYGSASTTGYIGPGAYTSGAMIAKHDDKEELEMLDIFIDLEISASARTPEGTQIFWHSEVRAHD